MPGSGERAALYNQLKEQGWEPDKKFSQYSMDELREIRELFLGDEPRPAGSALPEPEPEKGAEPEALPEGVVRIDEAGRHWLQEEVRKPAYPKPRGRRVLTYVDPGVQTETFKSGEYVETIEVPGNRTNRVSEIKITLPSYQVGIYRDPRFPFKVHCYDGREGFDFEDVIRYYGGAELVPSDCRRIYIENDLCYEIRSVVAAIRAEYRQLMLQKGNR